MEGEIYELYNFNYNCVYHIDSIKNEEEKKTQYKYDLLQIISESDNDDLYNIKLYGIFIILNSNEDTKNIFKYFKIMVSSNKRPRYLCKMKLILFYRLSALKKFVYFICKKIFIILFYKMINIYYKNNA